jgi:hypothetical protein
VGQVVEYLPSKCEALVSTPSNEKISFGDISDQKYP